MTNEKMEKLAMFSAIVFVAMLSAGSHPLFGLTVIMGILTTWHCVKSTPKMQKVRIKK